MAELDSPPRGPYRDRTSVIVKVAKETANCAALSVFTLNTDGNGIGLHGASPRTGVSAQ